MQAAVTQPAGQPILEARGVRKEYGGVRALNGLDLAMMPGELHCIIGPNGAGKSTLFKMLMGIERPTSGAILYRGRDVTRLPAYRRARMGLTIKYQNIRVFQDLTVFQNLFIPLRRHHAPQQIPSAAAQLLSRIRLQGTEEVLVRNLSHGQQQWLSIGMSLAASPEVLLLDEPTAGMSIEETTETAAIVRDFNAQGVTVIVIEHDMAFVRSLDARTSVLHFGKLFAQGSFAEIEADENVHRIYLGAI